MHRAAAVAAAIGRLLPPPGGGIASGGRQVSHAAPPASRAVEPGLQWDGAGRLAKHGLLLTDDGRPIYLSLLCLKGSSLSVRSISLLFVPSLRPPLPVPGRREQEQQRPVPVAGSSAAVAVRARRRFL